MSHGRFENPVEATLTGIKDLFGKQALEDRLHDGLRFDGKTCLVTGASSGLGFSVAAQLAERGARVLTVSRSGIPGAGDAIRERSGGEVEMFQTDLSDLAQTAALADELARRKERLDVVVDNAGVATPRARRTPQGLDAMFATNYVAKFVLLTRLLKNGVIANRTYASGRESGPIPRIVIVSSDSHRGASAIDWEELGTYYEYGVNKGINNYSYFKLVLNTFASELARRLSTEGIDVPVHVICPGPVDSNIARDAPPALKLFMKPVFKVFFRNPEVAAKPVVLMCADEEFERETNRYLHMFNPKRMDEKCYDRAAGERLWTFTEKLLAQHGL
jgi:NAD(P)-dependent dehydrogenase (short-subunit alcohol dehydrogenase family)